MELFAPTLAFEGWRFGEYWRAVSGYNVKFTRPTSPVGGCCVKLPTEWPCAMIVQRANFQDLDISFFIAASRMMLFSHSRKRMGINNVGSGCGLFLVAVFYIGHYAFDFLNTLIPVDNQQFNT